MIYFNLLHLAKKMRNHPEHPVDIVPLLPPFAPNYHLDGDFIPTLPFSEVFDLPRLADIIDMPIVEWKELKSIKPCCGNVELATPSDQWLKPGQQPNVRDSLSCWGTLQTQLRRERAMQRCTMRLHANR
jgi:hypothetical protein